MLFLRLKFLAIFLMSEFACSNAISFVIYGIYVSYQGTDASHVNEAMDLATSFASMKLR